MGNVIITGAGGFVGGELTRKMIENGIGVVAISKGFNTSFPESSLVTKIEMDLSDSEKIIENIPPNDYQAFYHLAWVGVNEPLKANPSIQTDNIKMAMVCASIAKQLGCKKYLCSGTVAEQSVNSLPNLDKTSGGMLYGIAKHCTHIMLETYCKNIEQPFIWMQFSNIYGPQNKTGNLVSYTLGEIIQDREATFGPALQPYDFIYVDDLIEAVYRLGIYKTTKNKYFIGSGKPRILKDYLIKIGEISDKIDLIKIGSRIDDGIKYSMEMFDTSDLVNDIGEYVLRDFDDRIKHTVENY